MGKGLTRAQLLKRWFIALVTTLVLGCVIWLGNELWLAFKPYDLEFQHNGLLAMGRDGLLYAGLEPCCLCAFDSSGLMVWECYGGGSAWFEGVDTAPDGRVFATSDDGFLYCFGGDGYKDWKVQAIAPTTDCRGLQTAVQASGSPIVLGNDRIAVQIIDDLSSVQNFFLFDGAGRLVTDCELETDMPDAYIQWLNDDHCQISPAGLFLLGEQVRAYDLEGNRLWTSDTAGLRFVLTGDDSSVRTSLFFRRTSEIKALTVTGEPAWTCRWPEEVSRLRKGPGGYLVAFNIQHLFVIDGAGQVVGRHSAGSSMYRDAVVDPRGGVTALREDKFFSELIQAAGGNSRTHFNLGTYDAAGKLVSSKSVTVPADARCLLADDGTLFTVRPDGRVTVD